MESYQYLLDLAIILLSTKFLGILFQKLKMPQVVGALIAGLLIGPVAFNLVKESSMLDELAEIGVIILMFLAGMEADVKELKKAGKASMVIATLGVIIPLAGGTILGLIFNHPSMLGTDASAPVMLQNIFMGVILTATSVSITVETLKEMGKLNSRAGNAILGAAIIDDILGIIVLTIITSLTDSSISVVTVLLKIAGFFVFAAVAGFLFYCTFKRWTEFYNHDMRRFVITALAFALLMAYVAEEYFGVADITGSFIGGLIISSISRTQYVAKRCDTISYGFFAPIFFASIGLKVVLPKMSAMIIVFSIILIVVAIITKIVGCGLGAKLCHYTNRECIQIGMGMISRGEVALIVANKGISFGLLSSALVGPVIITVVLTTVVAPILLKVSFAKE